MMLYCILSVWRGMCSGNMAEQLYLCPALLQQSQLLLAVQ